MVGNGAQQEVRASRACAEVHDFVCDWLGALVDVRGLKARSKSREGDGGIHGSGDVVRIRLGGETWRREKAWCGGGDGMVLHWPRRSSIGCKWRPNFGYLLLERQGGGSWGFGRRRTPRFTVFVRFFS
jgi:hypothetical protein